MSDTESLTFKIGISGTYWDRCPQFEISLDGVVLESGAITASSDSVEYYEFVRELEAGEHVLGIRLLGKQDSDVVQNADQTQIEKDLLLNVVSIEIDEVEVGVCKWRCSEYHTDQPVKFAGETTSLIKNCVNLGFNGQYQLKFNSPFYIWLLETL